MSAYVNRLLDRFSPPASDPRAPLNPFVRSHSPIAEFDQRLDVDDSIGFVDVAGGDDSNEFAAPAANPAPTQIQRKAAAPAAAAPASATPTPAHVAAPASPAHAHAPAQASTSALPAAPIAAPRREPMDPGPLFDPFPRFFDTEQSPLPSSHSSAREPLSSSATAPELRPQARVSSTPTARNLDPGPTRRAEPVELAEAISPWHPVEREHPANHPMIAPLVAPARPREPGPSHPIVETTPAPAPQPSPLHYASPRPTAAAPFVPDPSARSHAEPDAGGRPRVHIGRVEIEVIPSPTPASAQSNNRGPRPRPNIDSISQIGPLAHYFPSRRQLRLRYR